MLFISPLKALFVLNIFNFCLDFLVMQEDGLIRKDKVNFKIQRHNPGKKQLQYTYCPISQEVKVSGNEI